MEHSFDIEIATTYGMLEATLLKNIYFWIQKNEANETNFYDGGYWTYNSVKAFEKLFPYASARKISNALTKLEKSGVIKTGNYNAISYDRTKWYALTKRGYSIMQKCKMEISETQNGNVENVEPIPDSKPDNKPDKNSNSPYIPQNNDEGKIESEPELEYKKIVKDASELIDLHRGTTFKEAPQYEAARYVLGLLDQGYKYGQFMDVVKYALSTWNKSSKDSISPQLLFKPDKFGHYLDVCNEIKSQNIRIKNKFTKQLQNKTKTDLVKEEEQALAKATSQEEYIEIWKKFHKDELDQC